MQNTGRGKLLCCCCCCKQFSSTHILPLLLLLQDTLFLPSAVSCLGAPQQADSQPRPTLPSYFSLPLSPSHTPAWEAAQPRTRASGWAHTQTTSTGPWLWSFGFHSPHPHRNINTHTHRRCLPTCCTHTDFQSTSLMMSCALHLRGAEAGETRGSVWAAHAVCV